MWRLIAFLCLAAYTAQAQPDSPLSPWIENGLAAEAHAQPEAALAAFQKADQEAPNTPFILNKISKQLSDSSETISDPAEKDRLLAEARAYAQRAVALEPDEPANLVSLAVCYGKLAQTAGNRRKVEYSRKVRDLAEEALSLNPNYAWAHHVLGRWHCQVAQVGGAARAVAKLLFGGLPPASVEEGILHLKRAAELSPDVPAHRIELGFAYSQAGDMTRARKAWEAGLKLPAHDKHDEICKTRAQAALQASN
jgi:tetratricopeptide (TPR) repeat protein